MEGMERSLQKLALMRKLAGTNWGADSKILTSVYTNKVRPTIEYASTMWGTTAKTNKNRLDEVQNMGLRVILGAMKITLVHEMEKVANVEPLERRRSIKVLTQGEKLKRLPSHPLHEKLGQPTKNRLKCQSLNHQYKDLIGAHEDILNVLCNLLAPPNWRSDQGMDACLFVCLLKAHQPHRVSSGLLQNMHIT